MRADASPCARSRMSRACVCASSRSLSAASCAALSTLATASPTSAYGVGSSEGWANGVTSSTFRSVSSDRPSTSSSFGSGVPDIRGRNLLHPKRLDARLGRVPHIRQIDVDEATGRLADEYAAATGRAGKVFNIVKAMCLNPLVLNRSMELYKAIMFGPSELSRAERE